VVERTEQLEASNRELEAFSYSVSHDLRAPLRHMDGFAQILMSEPTLENDARSKRYLEMITTAARRMGMLIDDLLQFSKMGRQSMAPRRVDFSAMVREVIAEMRHEEEGRKVEWTIHELPHVECDAAMMRQVWVNLISNALKYTRGKNPTIIEIGWNDTPAEQVFFVRDNGAGFEMAYADKLFGVFQRLHKADEFEGTGIGLANVRRIVSRHFGRTWAEGELDKGATIYFSLPKPGATEEK
jgi:light-regulated signal transduction histidine kinase (bacteriophytochrome)